MTAGASVCSTGTFGDLKVRVWEIVGYMRLGGFASADVLQDRFPSGRFRTNVEVVVIDDLLPIQTSRSDGLHDHRVF